MRKRGSGLVISERDVEIPMDDGLRLRADVFRPDDGASVPVPMTLGPYGKGIRYGRESRRAQ
jgi:uncharacterized protein